MRTTAGAHLAHTCRSLHRCGGRTEHRRSAVEGLASAVFGVTDVPALRRALGLPTDGLLAGCIDSPTGIQIEIARYVCDNGRPCPSEHHGGNLIVAGRRDRDDDLVQTAADGTFSLQVKEGTYDFAFRREGFATKIVRSQEVSATAGAKPIPVSA